MAIACTQLSGWVEPTTGLSVVRVQCVFSGTVTGDTIPIAWNSVQEVNTNGGTAAAATKDWYFDGTNVILTGFGTDDTVIVTMKGILA
jgi:hypothetical protein